MSRCCDACGHTSVWGDRHQASECALSRDGLHKKNDVGRYVKCDGCRRIYSLECLEKLSKRAAKHAERFGVGNMHDPTGVWKVLRDRPWLEDTDAGVLHSAMQAGFSPLEDGHAARLRACFHCESCDIPEPSTSSAAQVILDQPGQASLDTHL